MLLASAPRSTRARWLGVSTLVLAMVLAAPSTGSAQDGTVYIGGGSNSQDGARGVQGGDNVIVNMDALDGGRGRARSGNNSGSRTAGDNQPSVEFGEPYRGPAGAILRFPPKRPPESQLVVDPEQLPDRRQASRDAQPADPTPARKPERRQAQQQPQERQRTAAAAPETKPDTPSPTRARDSGQRVEVPDTPSFDEGGAPDGETRTAQQAEPETGAQPDTPAQPDAGEQADERSGAPTQLTARPSRKPEPPQNTRTSEQPDAQPTETPTTSEMASDTTADATSTDSAPETEPETTQTAANEPTAEQSAPEEAATSDSADDAATETASATTTEPADDQASAAETSNGPDADSTGSDAASGDAGETQTASLPPEALPEQMRLMFEDGSATLSGEAKQRLDQLAQVLENNPRQRVQLMAFAQGTEDTASQARRLSLSRALAVRTYLIDQGIRSTRMDVRALGATADQGPLDRVDIVPANR